MADHDTARKIWTHQPQETFTMSLDDIRTHASSFQGRIAARNMREHIVGALLIVVFTGIAIVAEGTLARFGLLLTAAGVAFVMWQLHRQARGATIDEVCLVADWTRFHRTQLVRQRDALRNVWLWYLSPLVPGAALSWIAAVLGIVAEGNIPSALTFGVLGPLVMGGVFGGVLWLNREAADALDAEIRKLDAGQ